MLIKAITGALIIILVRYVLLATMMEKAPENQVRYPKMYLYIGIVCLIVIIGAILLSIKDHLDGIKLYGWFPLLFLPLIIIQAYFNVRINYTNDSFIYSTFWGKKYKFTYDEIKNIRRKKSAKYMAVYETERKNLKIDTVYMLGYDEFLKIVNSHLIKKFPSEGRKKVYSNKKDKRKKR